MLRTLAHAFMNDITRLACASGSRTCRGQPNPSTAASSQITEYGSLPLFMPGP